MKSRHREWLFGFTSLELPGIMQIARAMTVSIVMRIACVNLWIVVYDRVVILFPYYLLHT